MQNIDALIDAYIDHSIDDVQFETLCELLREDDANRQAFARRLATHSAITEWCVERSGGQLAGNLMDCTEEPGDVSALLRLLKESEDAADSVAVTIHDGADWKVPGPCKEQWRGALSYLHEHYVTPRVIGGLATAAGLLLGLVLAILLFSLADENEHFVEQAPFNVEPDVTTSPIVATLIAERDAVWESRPAKGLYARQRLTLTQGFAEIKTARGAIVNLMAPVTIEMLDCGNALRLHDGKIVGICETESSKGFMVRTALIDVIDLGTRFGVDASIADLSQVHVFEGEVQVEPQRQVTDGQAKHLVLEANQAIEISTLHGVKLLENIEPDRFVGILGINPLTSTGVGLDAGQADPNWRIVAIEGEELDTPLSLTVVDDFHHISRVENNPSSAQWIAFDTSTSEYRRSGKYTAQSTFIVPETVDLDAVHLHIQYFVDDHLTGLRINGRETNWHPDSHSSRNGSLVLDPYPTVLSHGINRISIELLNVIDTPVGFHMTFQLVHQDPPSR